ncbi:Divergent AAA domain protein [Rosistilla ulvae]|uniref:Divergent AAA domain protein n=1 Tax=Rosistilla ulvae TaxID=1930277 RepID=A0A517M7S1_9BACT|nr:ATP-binding protein [Rosistilla ulvae]QDS90934.1 Divergent AAA domain protein [Rosistilla ulvae]
MSTDKTADYLRGLVTELRKLPAETSWVEFKENLAKPEDIGQYVSALSNAAAMEGKANAYLVWGVQDDTHDVVGTSFQPTRAKKGNEDLENWLVRLLSPRLHFRWYEFDYDGHSLVLMEVPRATAKPTQFEGVEYIRVGSYRKKLKDHPQHERDLWRVFDTTPFEAMLAMEHVDAATVLSLLDYPAYFKLLNQPLPDNRDGILSALASEDLICGDDSGSWNITNLGVMLFANSLERFKPLNRKSVRVVVYDGRGKINTIKEQEGQRGYANGFEGLIGFINALLPRNEVIGPALRKEVPMYPELAVRELVANALIHQDFSISGAGPMIEIFDDRMEITNPGLPLVKTERFLDSPPRSRNESLASFMRRIGVCEERGSGVDKVVFQTEFYQLPAPSFESPEDSTRAVLFAHKALNDMDRTERVRACFLHAALRYVERDPMTNSSLRNRFGIEKKNSATASRIIKEALEDGKIKPYNPEQSKKYAKYVPFWA